jgi:hypothetical protein
MSSSDSATGPTGSVSLADEESVKQVLVDSVLGLWDVVNNLTRLRPSRRDRYRVTIFGSARSKPGGFAYEETRRAAAALAEMGCDIITGGGPGLMQAANEGAASGAGKSESVGIRVALPFEQDVNAFVTQAFEHRTFFTRLHQFVLTSDAFVVAPGGIGTVLEMMGRGGRGGRGRGERQDGGREQDATEDRPTGHRSDHCRPPRPAPDGRPARSSGCCLS